MMKGNFLKKVHTAATFLQTFNNFRAKIEPSKNLDPDAFFKTPYQSVSILIIMSHPHLLMDFNRLWRTALQNKAIIVQLPVIDICS